MELAKGYLSGRGVELDEAKGAELLGLAATGGLAEAQMLLAERAFAGQGGPRNVSTGLGWLRKAAEQGQLKATYRLAELVWQRPERSAR